MHAAAHIHPAGPQAAPAAAPTYFAVLFTEPEAGDPAGPRWHEALRLLAALAEESPGYMGYDVAEMEGGREYAVTHWADPDQIARWKAAAGMLIGDNGLLHRVCGQEGCLWPWLDRARMAG